MARMFGGIHPADRKENTRRKPLMRPDSPPERVFLPLDMSSGAPAVPVVEQGQQVYVGELIARADGEESAHVHASVSGVVEGVVDYPFPWGGSAPAIVIANDGQNALCPDLPEPLSMDSASQEDIMERIQLCGITDMGRDASPAHWKILRARGRADTLIVNAAESDPYVTADHRVMLELGAQVLLGARALARALGVSRAFIAVEGDKLNAAESMESRISNRQERVELRILPSRYPLGGEKQIVRAITGREVPPGGEALDVRCVVFNVACALAVGTAISRGTPVTHRAGTVSGGAVNRPRNLWAPIGTPLTDLVTAAGGFREQPEMMLLGGPMTGVVLRDLTSPLLKNTNSLLCLAGWERPEPIPAATCMRCGQCVDVCPMHLAPVLVRRALEAGDMAQMYKLHPSDCMECGCCSYICPAHIPLVSIVRAGRKALEEEVEAQ